MNYFNQFRLNRAILWLPILSVVLASCGGGGDSGGPSDTTAPSVTVTSHTDGQEIIGARTITLQGTVSSDTQSVTILQNGGNVVAATVSGDTFSVDVTMADRNNTFEISATDTSNNKASTSITLIYPFLSFNNGQEASMVIGQPDFTSSDPNRGNTKPSANSLNTPYGIALDSSSNLYLNDTENNRILVFSEIPSQYDEQASDVIGQMDFSTFQSGLSDNSLSYPLVIFVDNDKQFIADTGNSRVLIWSIGADQADVVIGQQNFTTNTNGCSRNTLYIPWGMHIVEHKMIVADTGNSRVMIWSEIPTQSGQDADIVLGQQGFETCAENDSDGDGTSETTPSAHTLAYPAGVWSDGTRLVVADTENSRILIWNSFPTKSGQDADIVLGQSVMTTNSRGTAQDALSAPGYIQSNRNQLFITDSENHRVLIWDAFPAQNNEPASRVLGYDDFVTATPLVTSKTSFSWPSELLVTGDKLLVSDDGFHRVMIFQAP